MSATRPEPHAFASIGKRWCSRLPQGNHPCAKNKILCTSRGAPHTPKIRWTLKYERNATIAACVRRQRKPSWCRKKKIRSYKASTRMALETKHISPRDQTITCCEAIYTLEELSHIEAELSLISCQSRLAVSKKSHRSSPGNSSDWYMGVAV